MAFGRRKKDQSDIDADMAGGSDIGDAEGNDDDQAPDGDGGSTDVTASTVESGPHDSTVAPTTIPEGWGRIDLGSLLLTVPAGVELRLDIDESSSMVNSAVVVIGDHAVQVMAYAAPRTLGIWEDVRAEIAGQLSTGRGSAVEQAGRFGPELLAQVPTDDGLLEARFMGVDGPRWFLRGVISGPGAHDDDTIADAIEVFAATVVVRDDEARPSQEPLPVVLPRDPASAPDSDVATNDDTDEAGASELRPFERGPEITEIR